MNEVFETDDFHRSLKLLDNAERLWVDQVRNQLTRSIDIGKPIRFSWFREKKFKNRRLFFFVNKTTKKAVLLVHCSKKHQQRTIDVILKDKERYLKFVNALS